MPVVTVLLAVLFASGCRTAAFYTQAVIGHGEILFKQRSIEAVLEKEATSTETRRRLLLVGELREFAEAKLGLPGGRHYRRYTDLDREHVVWVVSIAPEFSLQAGSWWYPFVGRLTYRGFFREKAAHREAARWKARGYDVSVDGVDAYSTLGWFSDPMLNTFLHEEPADLAAVLFHELAHHRLFIRGDTDFNEAFATTVEQEGVRRWLRAEGKETELEAYEARLVREREWTEMILATRGELAALYLRDLPEERLRTEKEKAFASLRASYEEWKHREDGRDRFDSWFARTLNNARINTVSTYRGWVPAFRELLADEEGDLSRFYTEVERLGALPEEERHTHLQLLLDRAPSPNAQSAD